MTPTNTRVLIIASSIFVVMLVQPGIGETQFDQVLFDQVASRGIDYLAKQGQAQDGSHSRHLGPAVTALATTAILRHGRSADDPVVRRGLQYLRGFVRDDGGIYQEGTFYKNYETSIALLCFSAANEDGRFDQLIRDAERFLKDLQWDEGEGKKSADPAFGGGGYGKHGRPDLSNSSFMIEALKAAGNDENSEAIQRALLFVSRCQNLDGEHNLTEFASKNPDGGFYYTPAAGGASQAGKTPNGGLRSYGSMTYAGLKSMIYAGLGPDDPRVKAAIAWIKRHYSLAENPGMSDNGLYYYYHTFAKALAMLGDEHIVDDQNQPHDWRSELLEELARRQREDGAWSNTNSRWLEGDANLVTSYALLALSYCRPDR
jgi:squalene-hopene/tetraprenyl-beta-curcumene cyclase